MTEEPFGAKREVTNFSPVPKFKPLLQASRDMVTVVSWMRQEVDRADLMCASMESIVEQMKANKMLEQVSQHTNLAVSRVRLQVTKADEWCRELEDLTADLHQEPASVEEGEFKMPKVLQIGSKEG